MADHDPLRGAPDLHRTAGAGADGPGPSPSWRRAAAQLLDEVVAADDENGALANAEADLLRDALRLGAERLRVGAGRPPRGAWLVGSRRLVAEVWALVQDRRIDARSPAADAALDLRDMIDTTWWPDRFEEAARLAPAPAGPEAA